MYVGCLHHSLCVYSGTIQEHDLPAPTPATDDCPPDGGTEHDERDSDLAQANYSHGPVAAVQPSDDYRAVGGRGNSILGTLAKRIFLVPVHMLLSIAFGKRQCI